jgi:hypothetical protein
MGKKALHGINPREPKNPSMQTYSFSDVELDEPCQCSPTLRNTDFGWTSFLRKR